MGKMMTKAEAQPTSRAERIREFILHNVQDHPTSVVAVAAEEFGVSRQTASRHASVLIKAGLLEAEGTTRARVYRLRTLVERSFSFPVSGLEEDRVWRDHVAPLLLDGTAPNVLAICEYGFTEMVNNVIDHSESEEISILVEANAIAMRLVVEDQGVGIFAKIQAAMGLDDARHALLELSKGKLTTDPQNHSGEGIYFSSRAFDEFAIASGGLYFRRFKEGDEWLIEILDQVDRISGTVVQMRIKRSSTRTLESVFEAAASRADDYRFSKTHVPISLARYGEENLVSRSQAKRLLARFERFEEVMLDFQGIDRIGQAFADEIFRVFAKRHPEVTVVALSTSPDIDRMIARVRSA